MPGGLFGGAPAGSSGTGTGKTANVYTPMAQPAADQSFQQIVQAMLGQVGPGGQTSPAGTYYPAAQGIYANLVDPFGTGWGGTTAANALMGSANAANMGATGAPALQGAGMGILSQAFDPQQALFKRMQNQMTDQAVVANEIAGVGGTPYGASNVANTLGNFDINWQNQLLNRMASGANAASPLLQAAPTLAAQSTMLPYQTGANIGTGAQSSLGNLVTLGNNQYLLPQQILNDLQSYLGLGQSASQISGALGQQGFNQMASGFGGALSGANALFGNNGLLSGSGGLFGGGGSAAGGAVDPFATLGTDFSGGGNLGAGLMDVGGSIVPVSSFVAPAAVDAGAGTGLGSVLSGIGSAATAPFGSG